MPDMPHYAGVLALPHIQVQNANAISAPMTWGFPSMTAFLGLMWALERRLADKFKLSLNAVGVICHRIEPQVSSEGFTRSFKLTRNPFNEKGEPSSIVEEGKVHLDLTLIFGVQGKLLNQSGEERDAAAAAIADIASSMRVAGGSVLPTLSRRRWRPELFALEEDADKRSSQFRAVRRRWLPGFSLVSRDDLLPGRLEEMRKLAPSASILDAWLDLSRLNHRAVKTEDGGTMWERRRREGWIVPIPVGYVGISELHKPGTVDNARDAATPFRFVESIYSIGQWIGPHRLGDVGEMLWFGHYDPSNDTYQCVNNFIASSSK